jgi:hypothetical protein
MPVRIVRHWDRTLPATRYDARLIRLGRAMPLFDRTHTSAELTAEIIDEVNALVGRLKRLKVSEIVLPEPGTGLRVPNFVRSYLQAHLRRCLMFLEGGVAELDAGRPLVTELCSRALYENISTICDFADKLRPLCEAVDYQGVEQLATRAAFATRIPSFLEKSGDDMKAPQILNQIDKMARRYPNFRDAYNHLSDIVHPNGLGAVVYFGAIGEGVITFADTGDRVDRARESLIVAAILLAHVELAASEIEDHLRKLSADVAARGGW